MDKLTSLQEVCFNSNMVRLKVGLGESDSKVSGCFNSNMVRLKEILFFQLTALLLFQFQYGTIKSRISVLSGLSESCFNSNMVRLKVNLLQIERFSVLCFNSNMVRLKVLMLVLLHLPSVFQFQYGTIKRRTKGLPFAIYQVSIPIWYD